MKICIATLCFVVLGGISNAQPQCDSVGCRFKVVTPAQIFHSTGHYVRGVGCRVLDGTKKIITAPFCAPICLPKPQEYRYVPGRWYRVKPAAPTPVPPPETQPRKKTVVRTMWAKL